jgi:beta-lactam-binding protein with PASTA domain
MPTPKPIEAAPPQATITVPDVLDEDATLAQATLEGLGLHTVITIQAVPGLLSHVVGFQEPAPGSTVAPGTTVSLIVAP